MLPLLVIGLTSRLDVVELLEKRVKSRFSHRQLTLSPPSQFKSYLALAKSTLQLSIDMADPNMDRLHYRLAFNTQIERLCENPVFYQTLRQLYDLLRDVRTLYRALMLLVCNLSYESPMVSGARFDQAMADQLADCKLEMLKDVSLLELSLLVAMRSLVCQSILKFNFEMVYDEYRTFMSRSGAATGSGMRLYKKPVALKAFEHLLALEVLRPLEGTGSAQTFQDGSLASGTVTAGNRLASSNSLKEYAMVQLLLDPVHLEELVDRYTDCPPTIKAWVTQ
ncbi:origin recognition complex subunit 4 [Dimargaris xerosporica]|nr:origin recognition complex subunit 4 [Dimargaris xerosporica]